MEFWVEQKDPQKAIICFSDRRARHSFQKAMFEAMEQGFFRLFKRYRILLMSSINSLACIIYFSDIPLSFAACRIRLPFPQLFTFPDDDYKDLSLRNHNVRKSEEKCQIRINLLKVVSLLQVMCCHKRILFLGFLD